MRFAPVFLALSAPLAASAAPPAPALAPPPSAAAPVHLGAQPPAKPPPPAIPQVVIDYYPAAARAAGVEGEASLTCDRDEHLALKACKLDSESPLGQGFGAAALAMAAKSPDNPKLDVTDPAKRPPFSFKVQFSLHPPGISPDPTQMGHMVTQPSLVKAPTFAQVHDAYPVRALDDGIDGVAVIDCFVSKAGKLSSCALYGENPSGYGFGAAALELAGDFALNPRLVDGDPVDGAEVRVPVTFQALDPSAPLQLKTTPQP